MVRALPAVTDSQVKANDQLAASILALNSTCMLLSADLWPDISINLVSFGLFVYLGANKLLSI